MKRAFIVITLLSACFSANAQKQSTWKVLSKVEIETRFDEVLNYEIDFPTFSSEVKALNGKEVTLEGWMIPLDELRGENYFVLSALPFANCFFCGGAGPETVIEVFSKKNIKFTDKRIKVKGILSINADDPMKLMYILQKAELID